jgi:hypothetical protein
LLLLAKYYKVDKLKEDEMVESFGIHGEKSYSYKVLVGK